MKSRLFLLRSTYKNSVHCYSKLPLKRHINLKICQHWMRLQSWYKSRLCWRRRIRRRKEILTTFSFIRSIPAVGGSVTLLVKFIAGIASIASQLIWRTWRDWCTSLFIGIVIAIRIAVTSSFWWDAGTVKALKFVVVTSIWKNDAEFMIVLK